MNKFKTTQSTHPKMMVWTDPETGIQRFNPIESKVTQQFSAFFHTQKNLLQRPEGFWDTER